MQVPCVNVSVGWGVAQLLFSLAGMRSCRYIGVDNGNGISGCDAVGSQKSKVAFQWRFQSATKVWHVCFFIRTISHGGACVEEDMLAELA